MKKVLVTGGGGLVGNSIKRLSQSYDYDFVFDLMIKKLNASSGMPEVGKKTEEENQFNSNQNNQESKAIFK